MSELSVGIEVQIICICSRWCHCRPVISCFIKLQNGLTFLALAYPGCPGKEAVKRVYVCQCFDNVGSVEGWTSSQRVKSRSSNPQDWEMFEGIQLNLE